MRITCIDYSQELLKVRGYQVDPPELEAVLMAHPHISDVGVIGVHMPGQESELPRAYVARAPGPDAANLTEKDVYDYLAAKLARYKRLDGGVQFLDAVPRNPSGKILKRLLREMAKKELGSKL